MCVPSPEHTLRTLSTNRRGEGEAPPPAPSTYRPPRHSPLPRASDARAYVSVSAGGGGEKEATGRREEKTGGGKSREEGEVAAVAAVGVGLGRRGGASAQAPRPEGRGPRYVGPVGGGEGWFEGGSQRSRVVRPLLPHTPPPPPPQRSVNPSPRRWAGRGASGFHCTNQPPRAESPRSSPVAARSAPLAPAPPEVTGH